LVVGTSTGGIIALGLGAGLTSRDIVDFYAQHGNRIFSRGPGWGVLNLFRPRYDLRRLYSELESVFGKKTLADSRVPLVVPSFDLTRDTVYLFKTPHHPRLQRDWRERLVDVAIATSAAPTYFRPFSLRGLRLVDGGVWANNPVVVGLAEAVSMFRVELSAIRVLSLGTTMEMRSSTRRLESGGLWAWRRDAIAVILAGQSVGAQTEAVHLLGESAVLRLQPRVPAGLFKLDRVDPQALIGRAHAESREIAPAVKARFLDHTPPAYRPMYGPANP
jgi:uncharacterized protein